MSPRHDVNHFKGGSIPDEVKTFKPRRRKEEKSSSWQGTSDREESLSDPRWHKRPSTARKQKQTATTTTSSPKNTVKDAREPPVKNFPKIIFNEETTKIEK